VIARMTDVPVFELRRARASDYDFVVRLYRDTMQPLLTRLNAWDESDALSRFKRYFKVRETQIIGFDGKDVGFVQVSETRNQITLAQIHIATQYRDRGIGTHLVQVLLRDAAAKGKPVLLSVVRGNRARVLYERLGFLVTGEDATRLHMGWESTPEGCDRATSAQRPDRLRLADC
jgi:ribosomal protein S18 acetylase RimI-like enzyme